MVTVRGYKAGDAERICKLFSENLKYKRDIDYWIWINRIYPSEKSIIIIAENETPENETAEIIGHYAILPLQFSAQGKMIKGGHSVQAFIHPNYREKISIYNLSTEAYKIAQKLGLKFLIGFPNQNYRLIQEKIEKWDKLSIFNSYVQTLEKINVNYSVQNNLDFVIAEDCSKSAILINELLEKKELLKKTFSANDKSIREFKVFKNVNYYLNRYLRHPHNRYKNFFIYKGNELLGFLVLKFYKNEKIFLHIVDFILLNNSLLEDLLVYLSRKYADEAEAWSLWGVNSEIKSILEKFEFKSEGFNTCFSVKILEKNFKEENRNEYKNFENWEIYLGDSDAF